MKKINISIMKFKNLRAMVPMFLSQNEASRGRYGYITKRYLDSNNDEVVEFNFRPLIQLQIEPRKNGDTYTVPFKMQLLTVTAPWLKSFIRNMDHMLNHVNEPGLFTETEYGFHLNTDIAARYDIIDKVLCNSVFSLRYTVSYIDDRTLMTKKYTPGIALIIGDESNDVICEMTLEEFMMLRDILADLNLHELAIECQLYYVLTARCGGIRVNDDPVYEEYIDIDTIKQKGISITQYLPSGDTQMEDTSLPL